MLKDLRYKYTQSDTLTKLIAINVIAYVITLVLSIFFKGVSFSGAGFIAEYLFLPLNPKALLYRFWTPLTYMFLHDLNGIFHILFNMLFLYWFGAIIQNLIGESKLPAIYVLGGLFGAVVAVLFSLTPLVGGGYLVGASGAVNAIMFAAVMLAPTYEFRLLLLGRIQIKYIALFKLLLDLIYINSSQNAAGSICHIGGAVFGAYFIYQLKKGNDFSKPFNRFVFGLGSIGKKSPLKKRATISNAKRGGSFQQKRSKTDQEKIDAILDKINESGYDSLTAEEKKMLFNVGNN